MDERIALPEAMQVALKTLATESKMLVYQRSQATEALAAQALMQDELTNWLAERAAITQELKIEMPGEETAACLDWVLKAIATLRTERDRLQKDFDAAINEIHAGRHGASGMCCQLRLREKRRAEAAEAERVKLAGELREQGEEHLMNIADNKRLRADCGKQATYITRQFEKIAELQAVVEEVARYKLYSEVDHRAADGMSKELLHGQLDKFVAAAREAAGEGESNHD